MNRHRLPASAIQTTVFATRPAIARDLFAKMFAGAVQSDGKIVFGQTQFNRDLANSLSIEVNALEQFPILLWHAGQQSLEALTKQPLVAGAGGGGQLRLKPFQRSLPCIVTAVEVNNGPA